MSLQVGYIIFDFIHYKVRYDDVPDTLGCFGWCDHILLLHTLKAYKTTMEQARDASDELVWQDTPEGKKPQMVRTAYGAVEWIEEQKNWIAEDMEKNIGWKRLFKGKNERGDLLLSDYRRERAAEKALEAEREKERKCSAAHSNPVRENNQKAG